MIILNCVKDHISILFQTCISRYAWYVIENIFFLDIPQDQLSQTCICTANKLNCLSIVVQKLIVNLISMTVVRFNIDAFLENSLS